MSRNSGSVLCGLADLEEFAGAALGKPTPPPKSSKSGQAPAPKKPLPKIAPNPHIDAHRKSLQTGRVTAARVFAHLKNAVGVAQRKPGAVPPKKGVSVHGDDSIVVGHGTGTVDVIGDTTIFGAATGKPLSPKAKNAVAKLDAAKKKSDAINAKLKDAIRSGGKQLHDLTKAIKSQRTLARQTARGMTRVHGIGYDPLDRYDPQGVWGDDPAADPATAPDPSADLQTDPGASDPKGLDTGGPLLPDDLAALGKAPLMDQFIADYKAMGGIPYDGSKGTPDGYIVSFGLATRATDSEAAAGGKWIWPIDWMNRYGYVFGKYDLNNPANGGVAGGEDFPSGQWVHIHGGKGRGNWWDPVDASEAYQSHQKSAPNGKTPAYGPLIGNPVLGWPKGMRVDGTGQAFWFPQEAPDWLTFPLKQAAALTKAAADKAAKAAKDAADLADAKTKADAAAAQAAQDAQNALAESQAASEQKQAESKAAGDAAASDAEATRQDLEERRAAAEQAKADAEADRAERAQALEERKAAAAQAAADAEAERAAQATQRALPPRRDAGDGGGGDGGGDDQAEPANDGGDGGDDGVDGLFGFGGTTMIGGDGSIIAFDDFGNASDS